MKVYLLIPAYNEAGNIPVLLNNLHTQMNALGWNYEIFIVNDGSRDATAQVAEAGGATVLTHPVNRGPGAAFRTGFAAILPLCQEEDVLITLEADNTSDLTLLPLMVARLERRYDVVLASVYAPGGSIAAPWERKLLSWGANQLLAWVLGTPQIHTYSSFFRAYRPSCLKNALYYYEGQLIQEPGFVSMVELLIKLHLLHARFTEVPMALKGRERGQSKMKIGRTLMAYGRVLGRYIQGGYAPPSVPTLAPILERLP